MKIMKETKINKETQIKKEKKIKKEAKINTLNSSESIWPPPLSTGVYRNEEPSPEGQ